MGVILAGVIGGEMNVMIRTWCFSRYFDVFFFFFGMLVAALGAAIGAYAFTLHHSIAQHQQHRIIASKILIQGGVLPQGGQVPTPETLLGFIFFRLPA